LDHAFCSIAAAATTSPSTNDPRLLNQICGWFQHYRCAGEDDPAPEHSLICDRVNENRAFQKYFNEHRTHAGLEGRLPDSGGPGSPISFASYRWQKHCRGLYETPIAA
jgi:hypothetical protein